MLSTNSGLSNTISLHVMNTFREIVLPSSGNVNDYVAHIETKYADLDENFQIRRSCTMWLVKVIRQ